MLIGVNKMLRIGWLLHQPFEAIDDDLAPVFDRPLVIVILSHVFKSV
jgi:hypothetical protein